jgi:hypothetical protein
MDANHDYQSFEQCRRALPNFIKTDKQMEKQLHGLSGGLAELKSHVGISDKDFEESCFENDNDDHEEN